MDWRLRWPFRRRAQQPDAAGMSTAPADLAERRSGTPAWPTLPALQLTAESAPLVAPTGPFEATLAGLRAAPVAAATLGHDRGLEAPPGIVLGVAVPRHAAPGGPSLQPASHRRAGRSSAGVPQSIEGGDAPGVHAPNPTPAPDAGSAALRSVTSARRLPSVDPAPFQRSLTVADPALRSTPVGAVGGVPVHPRPEVVDSTAPRVDARSTPSPAVLASPPATPANPPEPGSPGGVRLPVDRGPTTNAPTAGPARLTLGQSRRLRLGPPLQRLSVSGSLPPTDEDAPASPSTSPAGGELSAPAMSALEPSGPAPVSRSAAPSSAPPRSAWPMETPPSTEAPFSPNSADASSRAVEEPTLPPAIQGVIQRALLGGASPPLLPQGPAPASAPPIAVPGPPGQPEAPTPLRQVGPKPLSARPSGSPSPPATPATTTRRGPTPSAGPSSTGVASSSGPAATRAAAIAAHRGGPIAQRLAAPTPPRAPVGASLRPTADPGGLGVWIHRSPESAAAALSIGAQAFTAGSDIHMPDAHGPLDAPAARGLLAHELTHVVQQRQLGASLPHERSLDGRQLEASAQASERRALAEPSYLRVARPASRDVADRLNEPAGALLSRSAEPAPSPIQLQMEAPAAAPLTDGAFAVQRAEESAGPSSPTRTAGAQSEKDLDELARRLYERFRLRLRSELLVDLERSGRLIGLP